MNGSKTVEGCFRFDTEPSLDRYMEAEVRAGLALAGGDHASAAEVVRRARESVERYIHGPAHRLAKAWSSAVDAVVRARRSLPHAVAQLVALLCVPAPEKLAEAATLVGCGDLADRLITALARKSRGWLWTEGLAQAAAVAVDLLLALPSDHVLQNDKFESEALTCSSGSEADIANTAVVADTGGSDRKISLEKAFDDLDNLLGSTEVEGRICGRPLISAPGLKCSLDTGAVKKAPRDGTLRRGAGGGMARVAMDSRRRISTRAPA